MKKKYFLLLLALSFFNFSKAQVLLSVYSEVSIVTAGPGTALFEAFGHAAIRIKDPVLQLDVVYNYGMFDFNAPNFNLNFIKGTPYYRLGKQRFGQFIASYNYQKRWMKQQVLNLTQTEKQAFFLYLENNAKPENSDYLYDPYYNNCATKLRDITTAILGEKLAFNPLKLARKSYTLRMLMLQEIPWNTWGSFGINIALGSKLDRTATESQYMYLPDYVYHKFKAATTIQNSKTVPLVKREDVLLNHQEVQYKPQLFSPFLLFTLGLLLGFYITYQDYKNVKRTKWFDFLLLIITGFIGAIVLFLWFFTNHSTAPNNFNFLWAFAPNLLVAFLLLKKTPKQWFSKYFKFLTLLLIFMLLFWSIGIQSFPLAILPFVLLLLLRYVFLHHYFTSIKK
tara:strand:- start:874 stop:2058 length:1185 start_codon:yes stop_codon:yes gene_type:complete